MRRLDVLKVAAAAGVDPRTVQRAIDGFAVRSSATRDAIRRALVKLGFKGAAQRLGKGT